jgi:hypothetical protein
MEAGVPIIHVSATHVPGARDTPARPPRTGLSTPDTAVLQSRSVTPSFIAPRLERSRNDRAAPLGGHDTGGLR